LVIFKQRNPRYNLIMPTV